MRTAFTASTKMSLFSLIFHISVLSHVRLAWGAAKCFDVNGVQTEALPCDPNAKSGPCCTLGWICLSNGLCSPGPNVKNNGFVNFYRSDCTDPSWSNSSGCFSGCNSFGGNGMMPCGGGAYCCYNYNGCDCSSTSLFDLGIATFITTLPLSTIVPTSTPASTSASTTAAATTTAASSASQGAATSQADNPSPTQAKSSSNSVAIGAGVGVGVGIPLLAVIAGLIYFLTRKKKQTPYAAGPNHEMEAPEVRHEAPSGPYYPVEAPSPKYAHEAFPPQEMDATVKR